MNRNNVEDTLLKIGIPAGIKGFGYIMDAIMLLDKNSEMSITKELYPQVAELNNTTGIRVERAIRHAFKISRRLKGNHDAVEYYIGFMNCANSNSLKMLCARIKQEHGTDKNASDEINIDNRIRKIIREELEAFMGGENGNRAS